MTSRTTRTISELRRRLNDARQDALNLSTRTDLVDRWGVVERALRVALTHVGVAERALVADEAELRELGRILDRWVNAVRGRGEEEER